MSQLVAFGDWHANDQWAPSFLSNLLPELEQPLSLYHVGDFGLWHLSPRDGVLDEIVRQSRRYLAEVNEVFAQHQLDLKIVLGNHENYDLLQTLPEHRDRLDGVTVRIHPDYPHLLFMPRSGVYRDPILEDVAVGFISGAGSIDKNSRREGISWWRQEAITEKDVEDFKAAVDHNGDARLPLLLCHESPDGTPGIAARAYPTTPDVLEYCNRQRVLLRDAVDYSAPEILIHGHWHHAHDSTLVGQSYADSEYSTRIIGLGCDEQFGNAVVVNYRHMNVAASPDRLSHWGTVFWMVCSRFPPCSWG